MSWKPEVQTFGSDAWNGNAVAFRTKEEAEFSAKDLMARWLLVADWRVVESEQVPNYEIVDGFMTAITAIEGHPV